MASEPLRLTRAELYALMLRAARGAGVPLGHGEDLAVALASFGSAQAVGAAARALTAGWRAPKFQDSRGLVVFPEARAIACVPIAIDALTAGAKRAELQGLDEPELIDPFLSLAHHQCAVRAEQKAAGRAILISPGWRVAKAPELTRLTLSIETVETLQRLAARTYVPATAASRAGAGAGAIDND